MEEVFRAESALVTLDVGGRSIRTTAEHPFWVQGRGWTKACDLIAGDRLRCADGRRVVVAGVRDAGEVAAVYNLRVAADHTYFVGDPGWGFSVWAHNACWGNSGNIPETVYRGDTRPPEVVFEEGLRPNPTWDWPMSLEDYTGNTDMPPSGIVGEFVGTTSEPEAAIPFSYNESGNPGFVYELNPGVGPSHNVNEVYGIQSPEAEIAIEGGVGPGNISGAYPVTTGGGFGPFIPRPGGPR